MFKAWKFIINELQHHTNIKTIWKHVYAIYICEQQRCRSACMDQINQRIPSLISAFIIHSLDSNIIAISKIPRPLHASAAEQAGLSFTVS